MGKSRHKRHKRVEAAQAEQEKAAGLQKWHITTAVLLLILAFVLSALFVPWHYDKASTETTSKTIVCETEWSLWSYRTEMREDGASTTTAQGYDVVEDELPDTTRFWRINLGLTLLAIVLIVASLFSILLEHRGKLKPKMRGIVEVLACFSVIAAAIYLPYALPQAMSEDAKRMPMLGTSEFPVSYCVVQHRDRYSFNAVLEGGEGQWQPTYGWFLMIGAVAFALFIVGDKVWVRLDRLSRTMLEAEKRRLEDETLAETRGRRRSKKRS